MGARTRSSASVRRWRIWWHSNECDVRTERAGHRGGSLEDGTLDYEHVPEPAMSGEDRAYLRLVETGNLIVGGFVLVLFSAILGLGLCLIPVSGLADEPGKSGLRLVAGTMATGAVGAAFGAAVCISGRRIRARTRRRFSITMGGLQVALGTLVITSAALRAFGGRRSAIG